MCTFLLCLIYLAFISLGLPDSLLGSAWPALRLSFDVPISYMGIVSMIISGGTICSSLMSERLTKRFGTRIVTTVSIFVTAIAMFGFSTVAEFWQLCLWGIPYGLGAGAIDSALNNYVALHYSSRHMSWLHCFWGVGTIISPYIMSYAIAHSSWSGGYRIVSYIQLGIALAMLITLPVWNVHKAQTDGGNDGNVVGLRGALKIKGVPCLLIGFFAYCAAEATVMLWASSYLSETKGLPEKTAAAYASLFFIGITAGRFISGFVSDRLGDRNMIRIGVTVALTGVLMVLLPVSAELPALAGFVVIGLGCAPVYPSIIHATPSNFGAENSQAIIGIQMASAYVGSTFMPPVFGLIANHLNIRLMPFYIALFLVLMIVMTERTFGMKK
ncbi:MAG: MFS transporter [Huintestinicola sp.]|uniref:MFS transporter n=1 Tax=Huintestinicola sp. TaxID=2981661 RepID=UPI003F114A7B